MSTEILATLTDGTILQSIPLKQDPNEAASLVKDGFTDGGNLTIPIDSGKFALIPGRSVLFVTLIYDPAEAT